MDSGERRRAANERAGRQLGVIARHQALELGLSPSAIARLLASGEWVPLCRGVYLVATFPRSQRQRLLGACLFFGDDAVVSHRSAGRLWQLDGVASARPEITLARSGRAAFPGVRIHRSRVEATDRRSIDGIPVTSPERTLIDLAAVLDGAALELALEDAFRRGLTTHGRVQTRLDALGGKGRAGSGTLRRLLRLRQAPPAESALEVRVERFLRERGLAHRFVRQHEVWDGERRRRLDWAVPEEKLALEADSWRYHSSRQAWSRDRARNDRLEALGWRFVSVTDQGLTRDPDLLEARIVRALDTAA